MYEEGHDVEGVILFADRGAIGAAPSSIDWSTDALSQRPVPTATAKAIFAGASQGGGTPPSDVVDSDVSVDVPAGFGRLKGATLGLTAFQVTAVGPDPDGPGASVLPSLTVDLL